MMRDVISMLMLSITCAEYRLASRELNECPTMQETLQCESMITSEGFIMYQVPQEMTAYLRDRHCEHGWYHTNGTFIVDSTVDGETLGYVVAVTPESLTLSTCASLQWELHCDNVQLHCIINYTVKHRSTHGSLPGNDTLSEDEEAGDQSNSPNWIIAVIVGSVFVTILPATVWLIWKKQSV